MSEEDFYPSHHSYHHRGPVKPFAVDHELRSRHDGWQFVDEVISACGSEAYPWDPAVIKALREIEPDACPLWVTSVYLSPAKTIHKFGRHAIGIDTKNHDQESSRPALRVWTASYGVNAGRRPIVVDSLLQDRKVRIVPELAVFGYVPFGWQVVAEAKRSAWERRHQLDPEKEAIRYEAETREEVASQKAKLDAEADYGFDHDTNRGQKVIDAIQKLSTSEMKALGVF